ncbi:MAG TPA: AraC family transcriptional regulator [Myxococcales bacterium]|nr:AraC family transcriptional regulator [Myxococcales bacterium]
MDALGSVLQWLRFSGAAYCRATLGAPWGVSYPPVDKALIHVVERGAAWLTVAGETRPIPLSAGDLVLFPRSLRHQFQDRPGSPVYMLDHVIGMNGDGSRCESIRRGGRGAESVLVCGGVGFAAGAPDSLLRSLPPYVLVRAQQTETLPGLSATVRLFCAEAASDRPGASLLSARLAEVMFVQALRAWVDEGDAGRRGLLGALRDPQIAQALSLIHASPQTSWTVESLARKVAMSRSSFAARFTQLTGHPPLRYVTRWRMSLAAEALRGGNESITELADRLGYGSQAALTKAFKREHGVPPGRHRGDLPPAREAETVGLKARTA